jgi:ketosteroid isomerase-like protein
MAPGWLSPHDFRFIDQEGSPMTFEEFDVFWRSYTDALTARDVKRVLDCYTEDIVYDESPMMMSAPRNGKKQCQEYWSKVFEAFSSISIATTSIAFNDDRAWVEWTMNNFHAKTKANIEIHGSLVVTMREGKLAHEKLFWDRSKLERDLGAWNGLARTGIALNVLLKKLSLQHTGGA